MGRSLIQKLVDTHLVEGGSSPGDEIALRVDQVLLQDATGAMAFLCFEAMGLNRVVPRIVVQYADHQTLQNDGRHSDDHQFLESACRRYGAYYAKPGVGICHVVHLEQFARPGESALGSDSHTPHLGAVAMLAIGAGGIDVAVAMGGGPYILPRPSVTRVNLHGKLRPWSTAKDVILELLRRYSVRGGIGRAFEYGGPGVGTLTVPERATIANMGTELGLTFSVFASDELTRDYFERLGRSDDWRPLAADEDATYDDQIDVDLSAIEPLIACPNQPDNVVPIGEVVGTTIEQVIVGSCTNGSYHDLAAVARIVRGRSIHPRVTCIVFPGTFEAGLELTRAGHTAELMAAGVVVSESTCGACPGYVHVPAQGTRSLRTFNRNFKGRSGVRDDKVYLCSPEVAAVSALAGAIVDPRSTDIEPPSIELPISMPSRRLLLVPPTEEEIGADLIKGPNIAVVPLGRAYEGTLAARVTIRLGDKISTDDITPAGAEAITFRTNVPKLAEFVFRRVDPEFVGRAKAVENSAIVGGDAYGQGSSREHAAIAPMYLGVRMVIAKSLARIHRANLINWGILPFEFENPGDYDAIELGDWIEVDDVAGQLSVGPAVEARVRRTGQTVALRANLTDRERRVVLAGGVLAHTRQQMVGAPS